MDANTAWAVGDAGTILHASGGGGSTFYFAEGYTGHGFQEYLCLGNPNQFEAEVTITYIFQDGATDQRQLSIPANSRFTANVNTEAGEDKEVSVMVEADSPIVAERPMYFQYMGIWEGGHDVIGATSTSNNWYFAEGYTGYGFEEWICVLNPGDSIANLIFNFQTQEEGLIQRSGLAVPAHSRGSFKVNDVLGPDYQTSLKLESDQPVVAERPMYFSYAHNVSSRGGHCVTGAPSLAKGYYFAEGTTRSGFDEWLTLQNPNSKSITVTASYQPGVGQGEAVGKSYAIPAGTRLTLYVPDEVGLEKDVSAHLFSDDLFIAERPMYFSYGYADLSVQGGHCVIGATSPSFKWFFAEGYTGSGFNQWLCIQNPSQVESGVVVTYYTQEEGPIETSPFYIPAKSRITVMVNDHAGSGYQLSCLVKAYSGSAIIVERPMYFSYNGWDGGHTVVGCPP
ncbi:MAG: DUF5719 family protein [Actinomycetota bacterium]|nr:DUF5719 family protein [Actinomycetota bacterium]